MSRPTYEQVQALVEFLETNTDIAKGHLKTSSAKLATKRKWAEAAGRFNAMGGAIKNGEGWAKYWAEKKCGLKKRCIKQDQSYRRTGGGVDSVPLLSESDLRLVEVMGGTDFATGNVKLAKNPFQKLDEFTSVPSFEKEVTVMSELFEGPSCEPVTQLYPKPSTSSSATAASQLLGFSDPATHHGPITRTQRSEVQIAMDKLTELEQKRVEADLLKAKNDENTAVALNNIAVALEQLSKGLDNGLCAIASAISSFNKI